MPPTSNASNGDASVSAVQDEPSQEMATSEQVTSSSEKRPASSEAPRSKTRSRLRQYDDEMERLRMEYDAEVEACADLREQLEQRDAEIQEVTGPLHEELAKLQADIDALETGHVRTMMHLEDKLGKQDRLLGGRGREISFLERRLHLLQQSYQQLLRDDQELQDTEAEEALRTTDKEVSLLQGDVQRRETEISALSLDLKNLLDYMICTNIDAAGGPADDLGPEEFLPDEVREHLDLGEHGKQHLDILIRKYQLHMRENEEQSVFEMAKGEVLQNSLRPSPKTLSRSQDGSHNDAASSRRGEGLVTKRLDEDEPVMRGSEVEAKPTPLVATGLGEEEMEADWDWQDDQEESCIGESEIVVENDVDAHPVVEPDPAPEISFLEERQLLRETLASEAQKVAASLGIGSDDPKQQRPLSRVFKAIAAGDDSSVKGLLPEFVDASFEDDDLLGWSAWHIAAWSGHTSILDCLKEDMYQRGAHHLDAHTPSAMGMPPLGVACLRGQVDAVRSLLMGMAPVDARDCRGNTPLLWALAGEQAESLVPMLLAARADPSARNKCGHFPDVAEFSAAAVTDEPGGSFKADHPYPSAADTNDSYPQEDEYLVEPYHQLCAIGAQPPTETTLLNKTLSMLKAPARDAAGFAKSERAKTLARLTAAEQDCGVYTEFMSNYTHAGLQSCMDVSQTAADPSSTHLNRQALVLTSERLLLFNAASWSLIQVIALSEILQIIVSSYSDTLLILRMHRMPDVLLDIGPRGRFLKELQLATQHVAAMWGGTADFSGVVQVQNEAEPLVALMDEWRRRIGTVAFLEQDMFLLLPYNPNSVLMSAGEVFFFGFLDLHYSVPGSRRHSGGAAWDWKWQSHLFVLKSGQGQERKLEWCRHPSDTKSVGCVQVEKIREVMPLDMPDQEGACMIIDFEGDSGLKALTLRARTPNNREDWITSIRTMQTWL